MAWKGFPHLLALSGGIHQSTLGSSYKGLVSNVDVFFDVYKNNLLNKQSSLQWLETPWGSFDTSIMMGPRPYSSGYMSSKVGINQQINKICSHIQWHSSWMSYMYNLHYNIIKIKNLKQCHSIFPEVYETVYILIILMSNAYGSWVC